MTDVAAIGAGSRHLAGQRGGGHLAAGHAVDGVVDEDDGDLFTARSRVNNLRCADGGQVAVALIGEHGPVGQHALDARRHGGRAAVRGLHHIAVEVIIGKHRATHGRDAHSLVADTQLVQGLGHQAVNDAMRATGAVMERLVGKQTGLFKHDGHYRSPPFGF